MSADDWTQERVDLLKRLNALGLSATAIMKRLRANGMESVSRSAVIGKIDRLRQAGQSEVDRAEPWRPSLEDRPNWLRFNKPSQERAA